MKCDSKFFNMLYIFFYMVEWDEFIILEDFVVMICINFVVVWCVLVGFCEWGYVYFEKGCGGGWIFVCDLENVSL